MTDEDAHVRAPIVVTPLPLATVKATTSARTTETAALLPMEEPTMTTARLTATDLLVTFVTETIETTSVATAEVKSLLAAIIRPQSVAPAPTVPMTSPAARNATAPPPNHPRRSVPPPKTSGVPKK